MTISRRFYFIRHGETDWNSKYRKIQGHSDVPLNQLGHQQANALGEIVKPLNIHQLICSDLMRAQQTAKALNLPIVTSHLLREINCGIGEGKTWEEIEEIMPQGFRETWTNNSPESMDLRFTDGESRREVLVRVCDIIKQSLNEFPDQNLAFVSHGFVMRSLVYHFGEVEDPFLVPNCGVLPFEYFQGMVRYIGPKKSTELKKPDLALSL